MDMDAPASDADKVPVTVLTGFLGSGKTTLFNHILTASHGKKLAVIQNEFGEVGVDDRLMGKNTKFATDDGIMEVLNGCVCCSMRTDLAKVLQKLGTRVKAGELVLDGIVIETTGMANPAPVVQTIIGEPDIKAFARMDGVVTLVDAKHIELHLDDEKADGAINEAVCQVCFADRLLLNKVDLMPEETDLARVEARLREINSFAPIRRCTRSNVSVDEVLGIYGFDLQRTLERDPAFMDPKHAPTKHDARVCSHSIDQGAPRHLCGVKKGDLDLELVEGWLVGMLEAHGDDLYRMKGVLAIANATQRFVFHGVHKLMEGDFEAPWADGEARQSRLVFIGKNLEPAALNASFNACLSTPQLHQARLKALRFAAGDVVECNVGGSEWAVGEIVSLMYRDEKTPPGRVRPYQIRLAEKLKGFENEYVYAVYDEDVVVRQRLPFDQSLVGLVIHGARIPIGSEGAGEAEEVHTSECRIGASEAFPGKYELVFECEGRERRHPATPRLVHLLVQQQQDREDTGASFPARIARLLAALVPACLSRPPPDAARHSTAAAAAHTHDEHAGEHDEHCGHGHGHGHGAQA